MNARARRARRVLRDRRQHRLSQGALCSLDCADCSTTRSADPLHTARIAFQIFRVLQE